MRLNITRTTTTVEELVLPEWVELALKREKIPAIKALREAAGCSETSGSLPLYHAKMIVEGLISVDFATYPSSAVQAVEVRL